MAPTHPWRRPALCLAALCAANSCLVPVLRAQAPTPAPAGMAPLVWPACHERQARVMILGTYHFEGAAELDDIRDRKSVV